MASPRKSTLRVQNTMQVVQPVSSTTEGATKVLFKRLADLDSRTPKKNTDVDLIRHFQRQRRQLTAQINSYSPVLQLPVEITIQILLLASGRGIEYSENSCSDIFSDSLLPLSPFVLGRICHEWRTVVWTCSQFWRVLNIVLLKKRYSTQVELLKDFIMRSQERSISIWLQTKPKRSSFWVDNPPNEVIYILTSQSRRWESVTLIIPDLSIKRALRMALDNGLDQLSALFVETSHNVRNGLTNLTLDITEFPKIPNLSYLESMGYQAVLLPEKLCSLKKVVAARILDFHCWEFMKSAPILERCEFIEVGSCPADIHVAPLHLEQLQVIKLRHIATSTIAPVVIDNLTTPNLRHLCLESTAYLMNMLRAVHSLISRSSCSLQVLILSNITAHENDLISCMQSTPSLELLYIHGENRYSSFTLSTGIIERLDPYMSSSDTLLPRLRYFGFSGHAEFTLEALEGMLTHRYECGMPLHFGNFIFYDNLSLNAEVDAGFSKLILNGLKIRLKCGRYNLLFCDSTSYEHFHSDEFFDSLVS